MHSLIQIILFGANGHKIVCECMFCGCHCNFLRFNWNESMCPGNGLSLTWDSRSTFLSTKTSEWAYPMWEVQFGLGRLETLGWGTERGESDRGLRAGVRALLSTRTELFFLFRPLILYFALPFLQVCCELFFLGQNGIYFALPHCLCQHTEIDPPAGAQQSGLWWPQSLQWCK